MSGQAREEKVWQGNRHKPMLRERLFTLGESGVWTTDAAQVWYNIQSAHPLDRGRMQDS